MSRLRAAAWRHEMPLLEPYTIAYQTSDRAVNLFLRITDGRTIGLGCAAPAPEVTGETEQDCRAALERAVGLLEGATAPLALSLSRHLEDAVRGAPAAAAAVDTALHDLHARRLGVPLHAVRGRCREGAVTSVTLGIDDPDATVGRAVDLVGGGFRALKLKGGRDVQEDIERVRRVRERVGGDVALRFDANQGYDVERTLGFARGSAPAGLELIEQPVPASDREALAEVTRVLAPLPVLADEGFVDVRDAAALCAGAAAGGLVVKLMKIGTLDRAGAADTVAAAHGLGCMISCMDESAIAIAAALHWSLGRPNVRWVDLDGHLDLADDPGAGAVLLRDGVLLPVEAAGLGVDLDAPA